MVYIADEELSIATDGIDWVKKMDVGSVSCPSSSFQIFLVWSCWGNVAQHEYKGFEGKVRRDKMYASLKSALLKEPEPDKGKRRKFHILR